MPISRADRACVDSTPCPTCNAGRVQFCQLADGTIGVHPDRIAAWQGTYSASQHGRAVEARRRLENVQREIATAAACACPDCPSSVEMAEWLGRLGLLAGGDL
ncbi:hypothetical protein JNN96_32715 [Mycobacterium sp. DSM 3803]|nr:hypothetical protein [Mycobacterium sp. DSM 3803]